MTRPTINNINAALKEAKLPIYISRGLGYLWFGAEDGAPMGIEDSVPSIYSCHLTDMTVEQYVDHVKEGCAKWHEANPAPEQEPADHHGLAMFMESQHEALKSEYTMMGVPDTQMTVEELRFSLRYTANLLNLKDRIR